MRAWGLGLALVTGCVDLRPGGDRADAGPPDAADASPADAGCGAPGQACCAGAVACAAGVCDAASRRCP